MTTRKRKPQILSVLRRKGFRVYLEEWTEQSDDPPSREIKQQIRIDPESGLNEDERSQVESHKAQLVEALRGENATIQTALSKMLAGKQSSKSAGITPPKATNYLPVLRKGNFPPDDWGQLAEHLDELVGRYCSRLSSKPPRDSEVKDELQHVAEAGKELLTKLKGLSLRSRDAILDAKLGSQHHTAVDPLDLSESIHELVSRAIIASVRAPEDPTGRDDDEMFDDLLLHIGIVWRLYHPEGAGITSPRAGYSGLLRDFVLGVLKKQRFTIIKRTDDAISARLYKVRMLIDDSANRDRQAVITEVVDGPRRGVSRKVPPRRE